jgi:Zn-dependent protease with chaperone function
MSFIAAWLAPRLAFWGLWTAWLWCLNAFLLDRISKFGIPAVAIILGPPLIATFIGSRLARNPADTPGPLFWKGATMSCFLAVFATLFLGQGMSAGVEVVAGIIPVGLYMIVRGAGGRRVEVKHGDLFDRVQAICRAVGIPSSQVLVFTTPRELPAAFAHRMGGIMLSDKLLRLLSRRETDAVVAHEAAHLRTAQRAVLMCVPFALTIAVSTLVFEPQARNTAPFWPIAALLAWRAVRRWQEYDADRAAVRATRDPEALITALERISIGSGFPMNWGRAAGLFLSHPPMHARFRAIARRSELAEARVDEIVAMARFMPALPGYDSPFAAAAEPDSQILAAHRARLAKHMLVLSKLFPIAAGVAFCVVQRAWTLELEPMLALALIWIPMSILIHWAAYEVIVGSERARLRAKLPPAGEPPAHFVGLSTAAEPRYYDGLYHYDLGFAALDHGGLRFEGTRCSFLLARSQVRRVWLADGPPHWTPRKTVAIEYEREDGTSAIVSLQSFERWFWPATARAAKRLLAAVQAWSQAVPEIAAAQVSPPQVPGAAIPRIPLGAMWKALNLFSGISLALGWVIATFAGPILASMTAPFIGAVITAVLTLFVFAPSLDWNRRRERRLQPRAQQ